MPTSPSGPVSDRAVSHRIGVSNVDAVEQTRLWLSLGPLAATRALVSAMRTALLLADEVVLDRNQVLEGIFFVAVGPDRLAWHLGLEPGAPLPLRILIFNPDQVHPVDRTAGPWVTASGSRWGVSEEVAEEVERTYNDVVHARGRVSSPLIALTNSYAGRGGADAGVSATTAGPAWQETDPAFLPAAVWDVVRTDPVAAQDVIDRGRRAWVTAMKSGRVAVEGTSGGRPALGPALESLLPAETGTHGFVRELLELEQPGAVVCAARHRLLGPTAADGTCGRRHVDTRSMVVRWLDQAVDTPLLVGSDPAAPPRHGERERRVALRWWNLAYYEAITDRDEVTLLTLHNLTTAGDQETDRLELDWEVRRPEATRWEVLRRRLPGGGPRRRASAPDDLTVDGDLVASLADLTPSAYAALRQRRVVRPDQVWSGPTQRTLYDLALAVRDVTDAGDRRRQQFWINLLRGTLLAIVAVGLALRDSGWLPGSGGWWVAVWAVAAIAAGFPYAEVAAAIRTSGTQMQSTLRVRHSSSRQAP